MIARVFVTLKPAVLDAQGQTVQHALESLGFKGVTKARVGKLIEIELNHRSRAQAKKDVERMCAKLLANPVIETYRIELGQSSHGSQSTT